MRRVRILLRKLGTSGVLGLGVLLFCLPLYFGALRPAQRELDARREAAARHLAYAAAPASPADRRAAELEAFYALFPPVEKLGNELERLYGFARASGLELLQGEYRVERRPAGLTFYRVTLPVRGTYPQLRKFGSEVLTRMPAASIDGLRFERKKPGDAQLDAQIRLTIHFRPGRDDAGDAS